MENNSQLTYTPSQLARRLGISTTTLWRWRKAGLLPKPIKLAYREVWLAEDIAQWLAKRGEV